MKKYINEIERLIEVQLQKSTDITIIRLDGMETPYIYKEICKRFDNDNKYEVRAKLSKIKYEEFLNQDNDKWILDINYLNEHNFIDFEDTMTRWRNESTEVKSDKQVLVLLMGTEVVEDKGGLEDFYCINPEIILNMLKKDYSKWFDEILECIGNNNENKKALKTIFSVIFKNSNVNLCNLSNLVVSLENKNLKSIDEVLEEICFSLNEYWKIPSIIDFKKFIKVSSLKKGQVTGASIIEKSYNFINRIKFNKGLSEKILNGYILRIDKYADENINDIKEKFPKENSVFLSYEEFKVDLIDFIIGKRYLELKEKFMKLDYTIIDSILNLKVDKEIVNSPKLDKKIMGEPIEVFIKMILSSIADFNEKYKNIPMNLEFKINDLLITNCPKDEESKDAVIHNIIVNLKGLLEFLNNNKNDLNFVEMKYQDNIDPFINDGKILSVKTKTSLTELCKINISIIAKGDNGTEQKRDYVYGFENTNSWIHDFIFVSKYTNQVPYYSKITNKDILLGSESEESFFANLETLNLEIVEENRKFKDMIESIDDEDLHTTFANLELEYKKFLNQLNLEGIYGTFLNENICKKVFSRYRILVESAVKGYKKFTSIQKEQVENLLNMFLLSNGKFNEKKEIVLIPPYHPVMLEKNYYKNLYLKESMYQIIEAINKGEILAKKEIEKAIENDFRMVLINTAVDVYKMDNQQENNLGVCYGKYVLYASEYSEESIGVIQEIEQNMLEDNNKTVVELLTNKKSYKSDIICQNIVDYIKTFPARADGINLLFVNPEEIQHIVAGIYTAVEILSNTFGMLTINLNFILDNSRKNTSNYLKLWLSKYFDETEHVNIKAFVNNIDLKSKGNKELKFESEKLGNYDLTYVYKILESNDIEFIKIDYNLEENDIKYPSVYAPMPVSVTQSTRSIDISQRQFACNKAYMDLLHKVLRENDEGGTYRVIKKVSVSNEKREFIEKIHEKSKWVICLDETIDKNIVNFNDSKVIGFSTGKGLFGELNTTVSAREDIIVDIQNKLNIRLKAKFSKWDSEVVDEAATNCIEISKNLDGSKLLKALNPNDYEIHNYLAYVLTMQQINMQEDESALKVLINLDNYLHWFDESLADRYLNEDRMRPDFIILEINKSSLDEECLKIKANVIECKMGNYNEAYIDKAKKQVIAGIKKLSMDFTGTNVSTRRRYWFNQLYRALVFSKINLNDNSPDYKKLMDKLYSIYDGNFEIEWSGSIFAYWLNIDKDLIGESDFKKEKNDELLNLNINTGYFSLIQVGQIGIQKALLEKYEKAEEVIVFEDIKEIEPENILKQLEDTEIKFFEEDEVIEEKNIKEIEINLEKNDDNLKFCNDNSDKSIITTNDNIVSNEDVYKSSVIREVACETMLEKSEKENYNEKKSIKFLLGKDIRTNEDFYWEYTHKDLNNRHLLINGNSGSGKTYCIQTLILEAVKNNISVIVFDYTDGFTETKLSPILLDKLGDKFESRLVKYDKFPINPFKKGTQILAGGREVQELDEDIANRIANSFTNVYKFGDQQRSAIYSSVRNSLKELGDRMTLEDLREKLKENENSSAKTVLSKIEALFDYEPFLAESDFSWKDIIDEKGKMYVIQLSGYAREIQVILTELILWDIWNYALKNGNESTPMPLVLDEAQNLSHGENSPSGKILAEGRKFGLSGWYATQFMAGRLSAGEIGNLQQAAQKLYFSPPEKSITEVAKYIDVSNDGSKAWAEKLPKLIKGECVTAGFRVRNGKMDKYEPRIIKITSLEERVNE